jgi:phage terminase large subunit
LNTTQIQEIERLQLEDLNYWKIYGLGERGVSGATIFTNWEETEKKDAQGETAYGLDFGFNNPTALVKCVRTDAGMYAEEVLYQSHLTNNDLIQAMKSLVSTRTTIYCDSAEPDRIAELSRAGFNVRPAKKEVKVGIDKCKSVRIYAHGHELVKEIRNYKWKVDTNEKAIDEPVKVNDHLMDAMRYAAYNLIAERNIKAPKTTLI